MEGKKRLRKTRTVETTPVKSPRGTEEDRNRKKTAGSGIMKRKKKSERKNSNAIPPTDEVVHINPLIVMQQRRNSKNNTGTVINLNLEEDDSVEKSPRMNSLAATMDGSTVKKREKRATTLLVTGTRHDDDDITRPRSPTTVTLEEPTLTTSQKRMKMKRCPSEGAFNKQNILSSRASGKYNNYKYSIFKYIYTNELLLGIKNAVPQYL